MIFRGYFGQFSTFILIINVPYFKRHGYYKGQNKGHKGHPIKNKGQWTLDLDKHHTEFQCVLV